MISSNEANEALKGLLIFEIAGSEFCIDVRVVSNIIKPPEGFSHLINMPGGTSPDLKYGDLKFNLIDFRKILDMESCSLSESSRFILFEMYNKHFAFCADKIIELLTMDQLFIEKSLEIITYTTQRYIKNILEFQERIIYMPDFEKISKDISIINQNYSYRMN